MTKKLKIKFVKFECYLVAQQLEMTGNEHFTPSEHVALSTSGIDFADAAICLSRSYNFNIGIRCFNHNAERDEYLNKVINWISEEQFSTGRKLEIGKECMVSLFDDIDGEDWVMGRLLAILPEHIRRRYIIQSKNDKGLATSWEYARPLASFVRPKIEGDVYTWEMEVAQ